MRPLGSIQSPPPQGTCPGPARPKSQKKGFLGKECGGHLREGAQPGPCAGSCTTMSRPCYSLERPPPPREGGCQNGAGGRESDQDWYPFLCCLLAACRGGKVFSDVRGRSQRSLHALSLLEGRDCVQDGICRVAPGLGLRELLTGLGFSGFPPFCQIPLDPGGC